MQIRKPRRLRAKKASVPALKPRNSKASVNLETPSGDRSAACGRAAPGLLGAKEDTAAPAASGGTADMHAATVCGDAAADDEEMQQPIDISQNWKLMLAFQVHTNSDAVSQLKFVHDVSRSVRACRILVSSGVNPETG